MKTSLKLIVPAAALMMAITGCSSTNSPVQAKKPQAQVAEQKAPAQRQAATVTVDAVKEVAYKCGAKGNDALRVQYGLSGNNVVAAQVLFQGKASPVLPRVTDDQESNTFSLSGITWSAAKATAATVDKVDGNMLTQEAVEVINNQKTPVSQIVTKYCKLDKATTAKLAKKK